VAARLAEACNHPSHAFWPQEISLLQEGLIRWERILGPRQITDAYLLALAVAHGGRLVSCQPPPATMNGPALLAIRRWRRP
jgi:predicted nucleic acid-binding protein